MTNYRPMRVETDLEALIHKENAATNKALRQAMENEQQFVATAGQFIDSAEVPGTEYGCWFYYHISENGLSRHFRAKNKSAADTSPKDAQLILDEKELIEQDFHPQVISFGYSLSGRTVAFSQTAKKTEAYRISILHISDDGTVVHRERISRAGRSFVLSPSGRELYYVALDSQKRAHKLMRRSLSSNSGSTFLPDQMILEESHPTRRIAVGLCRYGRFLQVASIAKNTARMGLIDLYDYSSTVIRIIPLKEKNKFSCEHLPFQFDDYIIIHINDAGKFHVKACRYADFLNGSNSLFDLFLSKRCWDMERIQVFEAGIFITIRTSHKEKLFFVSKKNLKHALSNPDKLPLRIPSANCREVFSTPRHTKFFLDGAAQWASSSVRLIVNDFKTALQIYTFDFLSTRLKEASKGFPTIPSLEKTSRRQLVKSADGTMVPLTLIELKSWKKKPRPFIIHVYGAYGLSVDLPYSPFIDAILKRGIGFAVAHVRGGGELGAHWYEAGKGINKSKSIQDLIACAQYLHGTEIVSPNNLGLQCSSARAVTAGQSINVMPNLFSAAIMINPYLDPLHALQDPANPFRRRDIAEWGDPLASPEMFSIIKGYSPLENISKDASRYPNILICANRYDERVPLGQSVKYAKKLREAGALNVLLWITDYGHRGSPNTHEAFLQGLQGYAWLVKHLCGAP